MEQALGPSEAEKRRLREHIARQIQHYLSRGGQITVLDSPELQQKSHRGSTWHGALEIQLQGE